MKPANSPPRIALALSGGGFRASIFHLGMLRRIAEAGWLDQVDVLSTVSGGSLVGAFAAMRWQQVLDKAGTVGALEECVTGPFLNRIQTKNFIRDWVLRWPLLPFHKFDRTFTRTKLAARLLDRRFYDSALCSQLPLRPRLVINATGLVSIRSWRFTRLGLGDSRVGHASWGVRSMTLGEAAGASAAFPPVFPPTRIRRSDYHFGPPIYSEAPLPERQIIPLTDGGVYDNMGLEVLTKNTEIPVDDVVDVSRLLVVSDAGYPAQFRFRNSGIPLLSEGLLLYRVDDIARAQVNALRTRALINEFRDHESPIKGILVSLPSSLERMPQNAFQDYSRAVPLSQQIPPNLLDRIRSIRTHLDRFSAIECEALMYHAYLLTDAFLWHYRDTLPPEYQIPEKPDPGWRIEFDKAKVNEWKKGLAKSHKRRIFWPR